MCEQQIEQVFEGFTPAFPADDCTLLSEEDEGVRDGEGLYLCIVRTPGSGAKEIAVVVCRPFIEDGCFGWVSMSLTGEIFPHASNPLARRPRYYDIVVASRKVDPDFSFEAILDRFERRTPQ